MAKKEEEEEGEPVEEPKKEPLSLEELLAKKQAEEAARSKVRCLKLTLFLCSFILPFEVFNIPYMHSEHCYFKAILQPVCLGGLLCKVSLVE